MSTVSCTAYRQTETLSLEVFARDLYCFFFLLEVETGKTHHVEQFAKEKKVRGGRNDDGGLPKYGRTWNPGH